MTHNLTDFSTTSTIASPEALEWARIYIEWCNRHGFTEQPCLIEDLLDPERFEAPALSPLFDPDHYHRSTGATTSQRVNPYLHYFDIGWRKDPPLSRLVDPLFLRQTAVDATDSTPRLIDLIERAERDDLFTCHPLFDPGFYRRQVPRRAVSALIEFLREPVDCIFSPYVDLDMLARELLAWNTRKRNALICYLGMPLGTDINPMLFSKWYANEYNRVIEGQSAQRDMLSDFILIGCRKGFFPNPFLRRDVAARQDGHMAMSAGDLLEAIAVAKNRPAGIGATK